ncbi:phage tail protein [Trichocoleus sp. FACHB-262]|uniref:phage tail protein n=1 Tax=Trichocoleus sp. FACHB-262 TaxID=2692869 RepID=UPI001685B0E1|nr:phage tail protein [Trichocoleus sp. FACHB-262]MBD2123531.1 phage tail protein [Trichocoleus sp. FACHB-262]
MATLNNKAPEFNNEKYVDNYVTTNRFYVEIESQVTAAFSECSGLDVQIEKEVYQEGGVNNQQRIFLKHTKFGDVTLKRGMTDDPTFWKWIYQSLSVEDLQQQIGESRQRTGESRRRNINILVFNQAGETMQVWQLIGAVPVGWKTPGLKADSSTVALEELVLSYEGLKVKHKARSGGAREQNVQRDTHGYFPDSE